MREADVVRLLCDELPELQALYVFGSFARGDSRPESDLDLAILVPRPLDPLRRWLLQENIAAAVGRNVDLVDLRNASAVLRKEVLVDGRLLHDPAPSERAFFEAHALSDYVRLQEERAGILQDIAERGSVT